VFDVMEDVDLDDVERLELTVDDAADVLLELLSTKVTVLCVCERERVRERERGREGGTNACTRAEFLSEAVLKGLCTGCTKRLIAQQIGPGKRGRAARAPQNGGPSRSP
jgi:hypothetical protein